MIKVWAVLFITLLLGIVGCTLASEAMKLTEDDSGKTVELSVGDDLEVFLPANPTTGYIWEINSLDPTVLKLDEQDFITGNKTIGAGGTEVIKFHALATGTSVIRLIFHRPFEKNKPPLKTFEIKVEAKK